MATLNIRWHLCYLLVQSFTLIEFYLLSITFMILFLFNVKVRNFSWDLMMMCAYCLYKSDMLSLILIALARSLVLILKQLSPQICCSTWTLYLDLNPNTASLVEKQQVIILVPLFDFPFYGDQATWSTQLKESNVLTIAPLRELKLQL